ncbi:hypothetical protein MBLNU459_g6872t1 [Dothideomycetes sp. NU459]
MSDVHNTTAPAETPATTEPVVDKAEETTAAVPQTEEAALPEPSTTAAAATEAPTAEAPAAATAEAETAATEPSTAAVTEPTTAAEETAVAEPAKSVESGILGYKAPGLIKSLKFSKKHFWFGDEAVSTQHLNNYLRGEKPEVAHPTAAWSSQTGKGLLFFAKQAEEKSSPAGVLNLSEASDLEKQFPHEFSFKLHGHKHTFKAANDAERDGWFVALEKAIPEAKAAKEGILGSEGYKQSVAHLGKPAALAGGVAAGSAVASHRKSTEVAKAEEPARAVSSDSDEDAAAKKSKSRSASRNKRNSIFGKFLEKKDEHETKKEIKKEEKAEAKEEKKEEKEEAKAEKAAEKEGEPAVAATAPLDAEAVAARVHDAPVETAEPTTATATDAAAVPAVEKAEKPKPSKRNSIFGSFFEKVRSPTTEKKESEVGPVVPPKDTVVSDEAPQIPEPATETTALDGAAVEEPVVEAPATTVPETETKTETAAPVAAPAAASTLTPRKEKESFFGGIVNKVRAKSPANLNRSAKTEEAPVVPPKSEERVAAAAPEEPVTAAAPIAAAEEPVAAETAAAPVTEEPVTDATNKGTFKESRRKSFLGLFRKPSQAVHGSKEAKKEENVTPAAAEKTDESAVTEPAATEETAAAATEAPAAAIETKAEEPSSIGDVVPEAVTVGQAHSSNPTVSATA